MGARAGITLKEAACLGCRRSVWLEHVVPFFGAFFVELFGGVAVAASLLRLHELPPQAVSAPHERDALRPLGAVRQPCSAVSFPVGKIRAGPCAAPCVRDHLPPSRSPRLLALRALHHRPCCGRRPTEPSAHRANKRAGRGRSRLAAPGTGVARGACKTSRALCGACCPFDAPNVACRISQALRGSACARTTSSGCLARCRWRRSTRRTNGSCIRSSRRSSCTGNRTNRAGCACGVLVRACASFVCWYGGCGRLGSGGTSVVAHTALL